MGKTKFEFDPHNRLTVKSASLRGVRKVLDGQFKISGRNTLVYHVKAPVPYDIKAPHQVKLKGIWSLTQDHQLCLTLDKWNRQTFGDQVTLQGEILDVQKKSLLFAVTTRTKDDMPSTYVLQLDGSWQADEKNRLTFRVNKGNGRFDCLTFDGTWQIDDNYQITYSYQKERLARKKKQIHTLTFKGSWDIKDKARLSYVIDRNIDSGFDFDTGVGIFKDDYIRYQLGIGISRRRYPLNRAIIFHGKWDIKKDVGLVFEVRNQERKIQTIVLGAEAHFTTRNSVLFNLKGSTNRDLGAELELSRDIFGNEGRAFLRLLISKKESAILAGTGWRW